MNTPDNCYLDKSHSAHDLLGPGESCKACGFVAPMQLLRVIQFPHGVSELCWRVVDSEGREVAGFESESEANDYVRRKTESPATPEPTPQPEMVMGFRADDYDEAERIAAGADSTGESQLAYNIVSAIARARHAGEVAERERLRGLVEAVSDYIGAWKLAIHDDDPAPSLVPLERAFNVAYAAAIRSLAPDTEGK
jgi:hypothetical protein